MRGQLAFALSVVIRKFERTLRKAGHMPVWQASAHACFLCANNDIPCGILRAEQFEKRGFVYFVCLWVCVSRGYRKNVHEAH